MASRRLLPQEVMSNNGTNFVEASSELNDLINQIDEEKTKWTYGSHFVGVQVLTFRRYPRFSDFFW